MKLAYLILAHHQPEHLARIIQSLSTEQAYFFIHIDRKSQVDGFTSGLTSHDRVIFIRDRLNVYWGGFSVVEATLRLMKAALSFNDSFNRANDSFKYFILLSGSDYPIKSNQFIYETLAASDLNFISINFRLDRDITHRFKVERFYLHDIPYFNPKAVRDPFARIMQRFLYRVIHKLPDRRYPAGLIPYGGSQWWALTRSCVEYIVNFLAKNPEFLAFHHFSFAPDETMFHTIIKNSIYADTISHDVEQGTTEEYEHGVHYIDWKTHDYDTPKLLNESDIAALSRTSALFARKFDVLQSQVLLQQLDQLRNSVT